jgi:hypothetical protein
MALALQEVMTLSLLDMDAPSVWHMAMQTQEFQIKARSFVALHFISLN